MEIHEIVKRIKIPEGRINMVLDTDTYNEIDDQFALTYILKSPEKLNLQAIYAAPFHNERSSGPRDGMEKSYGEILNILEITKEDRFKPLVFKGSTGFLEDGKQYQPSPACDDLIYRAKNSDGLLYVVAIGAITNVASAIIKDPSIIEKIVVIWLGGHAHYWPNTAEFNMRQDYHASKLIFDCGVPLIQIPCLNVASHLSVTLWELEKHIGKKNSIGEYLTHIVRQCKENHFAYSRVIWDIAPVALLINPQWVLSHIVHSPLLNPDFTYGADLNRHFIRVAYHVNRDKVFEDFFKKV